MPHQNILCVSSNTSANNRSNDNSSFSITVNNPVYIPLHAKNIVVFCQSANIVNFFYNISSALGNNIIYYTDDANAPQKYTITLPDGAYDFANVNSVLKTHFIVNGLDIATIKLFAQDYTQKLSVAVKALYGVRFPPGIAHILGYPENTTNATFFNNHATNVAYYDATTTGKFNTIISLNLNCNLANSAFFNGQYSNLVASIPITATVGRIINYIPYVPPKIDAENLAGSVVSTIYLQVLDQNNRPITIAEEWNATISIEWDE